MNSNFLYFKQLKMLLDFPFQKQSNFLEYFEDHFDKLCK